MGRSRAAPISADEDANQRSKRRKVASSGEGSETAATGSGASEGKKALYHCNYCSKDISGKIRIKCTKCPDFDLCVECFSVGAEVTPHKSNHPYRIMGNLSFPLICSDWNADEEILLLEGIEMYGLGNWAEVAEHVGTKNRDQCINHYMTAYMNSPCYPFPDMSRVNGKNRKELLAMARVQGEGKKGMSVLRDVIPKEESPFSRSRVKIEDISGEAPTGRPLSVLTADLHVDRSIGVKKPKCSGDEEPSMRELSGYNPKRHEFDEEYDHDAEKSLAEMEFEENDSEIDRELKLRVLRIYLSRLDERKMIRDFILERTLLYPSPLEKELSFEDREVYHRLKVFMRFLTQEEHEALVKTVIEERKIQRRTHELQECRAAEYRKLTEAKMFTEQKRKREVETSTQKSKESGQIVASSKVLQKASRTMNMEKCEPDGSPRSMVNHKVEGGTGLDPICKDSPSVNWADNSKIF